MNKKIAILTIGLSSLLVMGSMAAGIALAAGPCMGYGSGRYGSGSDRSPISAAAIGTVTAINGNTLTVTTIMRSKQPTPESAGTPIAQNVGLATTTVYVVDASGAKIYKGSATTTVPISSVAIGDRVMVQGTVSGSSIVATVIRDGVIGMRGRAFGNGTSTNPSASPIIQGNGEPVIGGTVTSISGNTITVTNKSNVTYKSMCRLLNSKRAASVHRSPM